MQFWKRYDIITDVVNIGDPQILLYEDTYYLYSTNAGSTGYMGKTSKDLINWSEWEYCFHEETSNAWGVNYFWAPEVTYHNGKFVMHYSAGNDSKYAYRYRVGVAVSDSPMGPFIDVHGAPMFDYGYAAIDASVLVTEGGNYLYYSKDGYGNVIDGLSVSQTYCVEVDDTLTKVIGEPKLMVTPEYDYELKSTGYGQIWNEGPTVIEYTTKNGDTKYIMNYSANYYKTNDYAICMAVADDPMGPWTKPEWNPVLSNNGELFGAGHNAFFTGKDGKLYSSFHVQTDSISPSGNRRLVIGRVEFEEDDEGNIVQKMLGCTYEKISDIVKSRYVSTFKKHLATWANANDGKTTAFIGDSFFTSSFWSNFSTTYSGKDVALIGIGGSRTTDWMPCVDELFGEIAPKNVVIHLGTNDIPSTATSVISKNIKELCDTIHKLYPDTKIYYFGITQRSAHMDSVTGANDMIKTWCKTADYSDYVTFIDTSETFTSDMLKSDGLHMNTSGYALFVKELADAGCEILAK